MNSFELIKVNERPLAFRCSCRENLIKVRIGGGNAACKTTAFAAKGQLTARKCPKAVYQLSSWSEGQSQLLETSAGNLVCHMSVQLAQHGNKRGKPKRLQLRTSYVTIEPVEGTAEEATA